MVSAELNRGVSCKLLPNDQEFSRDQNATIYPPQHAVL